MKSFVWHSSCLLRCLTILVFTGLFTLTGCRKQSVEADIQLPVSATLPGFRELQAVDKLPKEIRNSIDISQYKYIPHSPSEKLWVFALTTGALGFENAKVAVSLKNQVFSMMLLSFDYDKSAYKKEDFSTYSGVTSIYNEKIELVKELLYVKGKVTRINDSKRKLSMLIREIPDPNHNWCLEFPTICNGNSGGGNSSGEGMPPYEGFPQPGDGGGGNASIVRILTELYNISAPGDLYGFDDNVNTNPSALSFSSVQGFADFLAAAPQLTADLSRQPDVADPDNKIEHGRFIFYPLTGVDVSVKVEKVNNSWILKDISSTEYGVTLGWSWEQSGFSQTTSGNEITIKVEGFIKWNIILEGIGTIYKQRQDYQIKFDKVTGKITAMAKL